MKKRKALPEAMPNVNIKPVPITDGKRMSSITGTRATTHQALDELIAKHVPTTAIVETIRKATAKKDILLNVKIDKAIAMDLLTLNTLEQQRNYTPSTIDRYVGDMKEGRWKWTAENLTMSASLRLLNGQQRLRAIVMSDTVQVYHIQTGLQDDSFTAMDIGKTRNGADTLSIAGYRKHPHELAYAIKLEIFFRLHARVSGAISGSKVTNDMLVKWVAEQKMDKMIEYVEYAIKNLHVKADFFTSPQWAFLYYTLWSRPGKKEIARTFMEALANGENLSPNSKQMSSVYFLRERLRKLNVKSIDDLGKGSRYKLTTKVKYAIKAWNFFVKEEKITDAQLKLTKAEQDTLDIQRPL